MSDTVTLALQGEVSLAEFSAAVTRFNGLIAALAADSHVEDVEWQIDALEYSSAITTAARTLSQGARDGAEQQELSAAATNVIFEHRRVRDALRRLYPDLSA